MPVKYVFVTGGVVSGLGKGITAASLGRLLKARGYKVTMQKCLFQVRIQHRRLRIRILPVSYTHLHLSAGIQKTLSRTPKGHPEQHLNLTY